MEEKVVLMVLKVDLECSRCYKKVKKVLTKFPQIRDQIYNEKQNTVTIKVVCCKPEKIRDKICCKGGGSIKTIEIIDPEKKKEPDQKPKAPEPEKPKAAEPEKKKKEPEKPKSTEPEKQKAGEPEKNKKEPEKTKDEGKPKPAQKAEPEPAPAPAKVPVAVQGSLAIAYPVGVYSGECYAGGSAGHSYYGYGVPAPAPYYVGRPIYDSYGGGGGYYGNQCDYFSKENAGECTVM